MKKISIVLTGISLCMLLISSCGSKASEKEQEQSLRDSVMHIHDSIMPWMEDIANLKDQMNLLSMDSTIDSTSKTMAIELLQQLGNGEDNMWEWMHKWRDPDSSAGHEKIMQYYSSQYQKIHSLAKVMSSAMQHAEDFLNPEDHDEK